MFIYPEGILYCVYLKKKKTYSILVYFLLLSNKHRKKKGSSSKTKKKEKNKQYTYNFPNIFGLPLLYRKFIYINVVVRLFSLSIVFSGSLKRLEGI